MVLILISSTISLNAQSDLYIINSVNNTSPVIGETVVFTIFIENEGPDEATNILVHEQLPAGMTFVSAGTPTQGVYQNNVWTLESLSNGGSASLTITATIDVRGMQSNIVEIISSDQIDPDSTPNNGIVDEDDMDLACVTIPYFLCDGDSYTLTAPAGNEDYIWYKDNVAVQGPGTDYTYIITEPGLYYFEATHLLTCTIENECPIEFVTGTPQFTTIVNDPGMCGEEDGKIIINATAGSGIYLFSIDDGITWQTSNVFNGLGEGDYQVIVKNSDESCESLISYITLTEPVCADLVTVKSLQSNDDTPNEGDIVVFNITITNNGIDNATNVFLSDLMPSGITFLSYNATQGSYDDFTGIWNGFSLVPAASATLLLSGTINTGTAGTILTNITSKAISVVPDPTDDGNDLEESVYVNIPPVATNNISPANVPGLVIQEVILEDDGFGADNDPDGSLVTTSIDLDPSTPEIDKTLTIPGEGSWIETSNGEVIFYPEFNFKNDPTPIFYVIMDDDGSRSNIATITVDYIPIASDDESLGNAPNLPVTVDVTLNDVNGDMVDPTTVQIIGTANSGDPLIVPGEGSWSVNLISGAITFTPEAGFINDPTDITYTVKDHEGNLSDPANVNIEYNSVPPVASDNESLANQPGVVTQEVIYEDDGYGVDNDVDGVLVINSIDLDPYTTNVNDKVLVIPGEGFWSEDGNGNVTFTPEAGFLNDPTPIYYTIEDNDGLESNMALIIVDYVPIGIDDESLANVTNTNVTVDVVGNDVNGDMVDPTTVQIAGTLNPGDPLIVANEGIWSVNALSGAITFSPLPGFTSNPTDIQYTIDDHEGNTSELINVNVEYLAIPPVASANESLANPAGFVAQEVIFEDDGYGVDNDADGFLLVGTIDLDPSTPGVNDKSLTVPGEGVWIELGNGIVIFTPESGFTNDPTPIYYTIEDNDGNESNIAMVSVDYVPVASNDESLSNPINTIVMVDVLMNDTSGDFTDPTTVKIEGTSNAGDPLVVAGEGTWTIDPVSGAISFTPEAGFITNPTDIQYTVNDHEGNISNIAIVHIEYSCSTVVLKVFLEGPYQDGGTMTTHLITNHLLPGQDKMLSPNFSVRLAAQWTPFGQPYNTAPWNYSGNLGSPFGDATHPDAPATTFAYDDDVVDWVLVTVREGGRLPENNIWKCAGWLHANGEVSFPEECECLTVLPGEDYYILVEHRNHLGVLSHVPVNKINGTESLQWDFTLQNSYTPDVFRKGQIQLESNVWGMYAANGEQINSIQAINSADHTVWKGDQNAINYRYGDFNLNVTSNSEDETIWKNNQNVTSGVIFY